MKIKHICACLVGFVMFVVPGKALAATIDFETLSDSSDVGSYYHNTYGLDFQSAIALTAGFSLNEIDFPPHSGSVVVGDNVVNNGDPMILRFVNPVSALSAYFAYGSTLTFSAYTSGGTLIGTYTTPTSSYLGADQLISLSFANVSTLDIAGATANSFIMDDLSFNPSSSQGVPDAGSTFGLLVLALVAMSLKLRNNKHDSCIA